MLVDAKLEEYIGELKSLKTDDGVWVALMKFVSTVGIDALSYYHYAPPGSLEFLEPYFTAIGFEDDFIAKHRPNHALFNNPFTSTANPIIEPLLWSQAFEKLCLTPDQKNHLRELYHDDSSNGLVSPVYGPNGRNGYVVFRFKDANHDFSSTSVNLVSFAAYHAHLHFCRIRAENKSDPVHLTNREKEVLTWVARGKSNTVIAEIVGISQHTVNGYLRRIYLKTRTYDRTSAALRAIGDSLIDFSKV